MRFLNEKMEKFLKRCQGKQKGKDCFCPCGQGLNVVPGAHHHQRDVLQGFTTINSSKFIFDWWSKNMFICMYFPIKLENPFQGIGTTKVNKLCSISYHTSHQIWTQAFGQYQECSISIFHFRLQYLDFKLRALLTGFLKPLQMLALTRSWYQNITFAWYRSNI